jgi:dTMP kinase
MGHKIRQILLEGQSVDPKAELFLFLADRAQHVAEVIRPALTMGSLVICDRYVDSTLAYQGYARGMDLEQLRAWNDFATGGLTPDLTLLLDIEPASGLSRIRSKDRLDSEPEAFHQKVRQGFLHESERDPRRWVVLDASQEINDVTQSAYLAVARKREQL